MGNCLSYDESSELEKFLREENVTVKGLSKDRKFTDKPFFYIFGGFLIILFSLLAYCSTQSDITRVINGYDSCGNTCGQKNIPVPEFPCSGVDMSDKPYIIMNPDNNECVHQCPDDYFKILHICFKDSNNKVRAGETFFLNDLASSWKQILFLTAVAIAFSGILLLLLRYAAKFYVWFIIIALLLTLIVFIIHFWILFNQMPAENRTIFGIIAGTLTLLTVILALLILCFRNRIALIIELIKEAGKLVIDIPLLILWPIITYVALIITFLSWIYTTLMVYGVGHLEKDAIGNIVYAVDGLSSIIMALCVFALIWMVQFIIGCQHMVISGSAATWFFTRNKKTLQSPILRSAKNLVCYHLGTVACGSLTIALVQIIRSLYSCVVSKSNNNCINYLYCCFKQWLKMIEDLLKYFTRFSYIQTAIYGLSFCQSSKRAVNIIIKNPLNFIAINSIGNFVLNMGKVFVALGTVSIGYLMLKDRSDLSQIYLQLILVFIISIMISHCFITVLEMAIDTIFLCCSEDLMHNDGISKPHFMSVELKEFIEKSDKIYRKVPIPNVSDSEIRYGQIYNA